MADVYRARTNPPGFENCVNRVTKDPQREMQTTEVNVLSLADQVATRQATGRMSGEKDANPTRA